MKLFKYSIFFLKNSNFQTLNSFNSPILLSPTHLHSIFLLKNLRSIEIEKNAAIVTNWLWKSSSINEKKLFTERQWYSTKRVKMSIAYKVLFVHAQFRWLFDGRWFFIARVQSVRAWPQWKEKHQYTSINNP